MALGLREGVDPGVFHYETWRALDPDALSPREALDALYHLKKLLER